MKVTGIVILSVLGFFALILLFLYIKSRRPLRSAAINAALALAAVAILDLTARFGGVRIPINAVSLPFCAVFGLPAVCVLVVFQTVF